jgi:hypothetical protein
MSTFDALRERFPEKTDAEIRAAIAAVRQQRQFQSDGGFAGSARNPVAASAEERSAGSPGWGHEEEHEPSHRRPSSVAFSTPSEPDATAATPTAPSGAASASSKGASQGKRANGGSRPLEGMVLAPDMASDKRNRLFVFRVAQVGTVRTFAEAVGTLVLYVAISSAVMLQLEPGWTVVDGVYFAMATMSVRVPTHALSCPLRALSRARASMKCGWCPHAGEYAARGNTTRALLTPRSPGTHLSATSFAPTPATCPLAPISLVTTYPRLCDPARRPLDMATCRLRARAAASWPP